MALGHLGAQEVMGSDLEASTRLDDATAVRGEIVRGGSECRRGAIQPLTRSSDLVRNDRNGDDLLDECLQ